MCCDATELPHLGPVIILLLNIIEDLVVRQDLLILIIIDRAVELEPFRFLMQLCIMILKGFNNMSMKSLAILLGIKQEGAANKVGGVECRELG